MVERFGGKNIHVVGISGAEGSSVVDFLLASGVKRLTAHDFLSGEAFAESFRYHHAWMSPAQQEEALARLLGYPISYRLGEEYLRDISDADLIFLPQGWFRYAQNAPLHEARRLGIPTSSMIRLFFEVCPCPIIGVTGTNGKYTTAFLVYQMLLHSGFRAFFSGNDRTHEPILYRVHELTPDAWLVLEVSNRQLLDLPYSPHIAVLTNIAPHHLDDHGSMKAYAAVKETIFRYQGEGDFAVLNADNPYTQEMIPRCTAQVFPFSRLQRLPRGAYLDGEELVLAAGEKYRILSLEELQVRWTHFIENALAASMAAYLAGASLESIREVLRSFSGLPYRMHRFAEVDGVQFYEDSLATNPTAAAASISSLHGPLLVIAGGARPRATAEDFEPMVKAMGEGHVRAVLLIGKTAHLLEEAISALPPETRPKVIVCGTLERAVEVAWEEARPGDTVLLSPGCESFDQFRDYRQRGDRFRSLVLEVCR
ncbi:MAG: UDP-N-acetylmuramoyl-L-alanine--D-glutamate ligase [Armatimonadota bacterium]|nr:UDP-N-acetylmuramoyl-L-alanine--D-glutamate ligase [Armatimonadota bacterium]MDR5702822.1 UDP-N-acetylmuramoyl-L-alanine--D-glutamate ligase [Armatimonadota bacterium]